jgi:outer membrane protein insertion porin family
MRFSNIQLFPILLGLCCLLLISSCTEEKFLFFNRTTVKNYPADTPFVYNNIVLVEGVPKDEKKRLTTELGNYWDDSLKARRLQQFGLFYRIKNPAIYDSANIPLTRNFMQSFLRSQGYYYPQLKDSISIDTFKNEQRVTVFMKVETGKPTIIDSFAYDLADTVLQKLSLEHRNESFIIPGKTHFTKQVISNELDRLVSLYRQNGFYRFSKDDIVAQADTVDINLLQLSSDPFEQAQQIAVSIERKNRNPSTDILIKLRSQIDSIYDPEKTKQFYNGMIYYYPETGVQELADSLINNPTLKELRGRNYVMKYREGKFVLRPLIDHTYMPRGQLYNEANYFRTLNNLGQMGAWVQVDAKPIIRKDTLDYHIFLVPALPQNITFDVETSRNTGDILSSPNLFGLALNVTYRNRNVWKRAIQSATTLRNGIELSLANDKVQLQTVQSSISHTYSFPRFITPFKVNNRKQLEDIRTVINLNASYADRKDFFILRSLVAGFGYEWKKGNKAWQYRPLNVELYSLEKDSLLNVAITNNPFLRFAFNTGSVVGQTLAFNIAYNGKTHPNHSHFFRVGLEESGALLGRFASLRKEIYQYVKLEGEYRRRIAFRKTELALRGFAGFGINYSDDPDIGNTLPFFKQFVGGGPNSMRAWGLRQIGLGSSLTSDTSGVFRDRFGDMQLETNAEYRYRIATIGSMNLGGAVFTDIGNTWNIRKSDNDPNAAFSLSRLGKDIAIGVGTGLRFDFSYFMVRLDLALKLKDPARLQNNGWLNINDFTWRNKEFEIRDQLNTNKIVTRNNYGLQLGIGLPF